MRADMSHSPGPWEAILDDDPRGQPSPMYRGLIALVERSPERTLGVVAKNHDAARDHWAANAKLIAAAPELLEALRGLLAHEIYANEGNQEARITVPLEVIEAARAALAKAGP